MQTIYLLSGLLCDAEVWKEQARTLRSSYIVRTISFQEFDSIGAMAAHVLDNAPEQISLAGHSMGGRVALEVYRRAPHRIRRLALLDTGYGAAAENEVEKRGVLVNKAVAEGINAIAETWALPMIAPCNQDKAQLLKRVLTMVNRMSGEIYARQTRALLSRPDATPVLSSIQCPTLVLCGQQDAWSPPERHKTMAALIPNCELRLIDDCGHMSMMEKPREVLHALEEWMLMEKTGSDLPKGSTLDRNEKSCC